MVAQPTPKGAWKITFLLFLFMLVNFADKIVVGLAGVPIMTDLKLDVLGRRSVWLPGIRPPSIWSVNHGSAVRLNLGLPKRGLVANHPKADLLCSP